MWLSVDPLFEDYKGVSPYAYCLTNPVKHVDVEGEWVNFAIGAGVAAASDYLLQVAINVVDKGELSTECFTDVDKKSIALSALAGAAGVGLGNVASKYSKIVKLQKGIAEKSRQGDVLEEICQVGADMGTSAIGQKLKGEEVSLKSCAIDAAGGVYGRKVSKNVETSREYKQQILEKDADRFERIAGTKVGAKNEGKYARPAQLDRATTARTNVNKYKKGTYLQSQVKGGVASNVTSSIGNEIYKNMFNERKD
jgi:hypothetical protein